MSICGEGTVEFDGQFNTFIPGLHRARLSEAEVLQLLDAFRDVDFYSLQDESDLIVTDAPRISIQLSVDGRSKTVTDRRGESKGFRTLRERILEISHGRLWLQQTPDTLQAILVDKENLNTTDDEGRTVLMWACESADAAAVRELNRSGANVRAKDKQGRTALMYAAARQSAEIVDVLLHSGAELDEEDSAGETAIHFSVGLARSGWSLFGSVADYTEPPTGSFYPHLFPSEPNPEVTAHLLAAGADPNVVDFEGATPLMYAAEVGTPDVLRVLLAAGADVNAQDAAGRTALMYAADHCLTDSVRLLVEAGADTTLQDKNGYTALRRVHRKSSKSTPRLCGGRRKQIIHLLQVARTYHLGSKAVPSGTTNPASTSRPRRSSRH